MYYKFAGGYELNETCIEAQKLSEMRDDWYNINYDLCDGDADTFEMLCSL